MPQTKHEIQSLLSAAGSEPRRRFGQNFMIDQNLVRLVADAAELSPGDWVLEVGPGTGTLTDELLSRGVTVTAVEIDRDLAAMLREKLADNAAFTLIEGDALAGKHGLNESMTRALAEALSRGQSATLVANLPYNIASPLIVELLIAGVDRMAITVQKEVAERLHAPQDHDAYGPLSAVVQMLGSVEILRTLPPQAFWPAPNIDSALVRIRRNDQLGPAARDYSRFVHQIFSFRRKTLRKAMSQAGYDPQALAQLGIDPQQRPENLSPRRLFDLFKIAKAVATE